MEVKSDRTVYLVYGFDDYEYPCGPVKAFVSKDDAYELLGRISAYMDTKPDYPADDSSDEEDEAWDKAFNQWCGCHPAGGSWGRDGFDVMPLKLSDRLISEAE